MYYMITFWGEREYTEAFFAETAEQAKIFADELTCHGSYVLKVLPMY